MVRRVLIVVCSPRASTKVDFSTPSFHCNCSCCNCKCCVIVDFVQSRTGLMVVGTNTRPVCAQSMDILHPYTNQPVHCCFSFSLKAVGLVIYEIPTKNPTKEPKCISSLPQYLAWVAWVARLHDQD